jgi:exodeoxyribonuclease-3
MVKIATWNVNSVRARTQHLVQWLGEFRPDIVLLQELKCVEEQFPLTEVEDAGYNVAILGQKTYNGVAVLSKSPIDVEQRGLPRMEEDTHARYLEVFTAGLRVASIYAPNGNPVDSEKFPYKLTFLERLYEHAQALLETEDAFVLAGDYNIIPEPIDAMNPAAWAKDALFQPQSRALYRKLLHLGLTDAIRAQHAGQHGVFSFWDYQGGSWQRDNGIRIDHLLLSPQAADRLIASGIDRTPRGWDKASDHTPAWCELADA